MSIINTTPATAASLLPKDVQNTEPGPVIAADVEVKYGDAARAGGLQNMLKELYRLQEEARSTVSARNSSLQYAVAP